MAASERCLQENHFGNHPTHGPREEGRHEEGGQRAQAPGEAVRQAQARVPAGARQRTDPGAGRSRARQGVQAQVAADRAEGETRQGQVFAAKAGLGDTSNATYREILKKMPFYASALATGLPFPKTRRVVYLENTPAALPGWIHLEWMDRHMNV